MVCKDVIARAKQKKPTLFSSAVKTAPAKGGIDKKPENAPKKKMNDNFPVTLNRFAVHEIPLANKNDTKNPIKHVPMQSPILEVDASMESRIADETHPHNEVMIILVGSTYHDITIPLDLPKTNAPKQIELSKAASVEDIFKGPQIP